jgi:hypothetical protein
MNKMFLRELPALIFALLIASPVYAAKPEVVPLSWSALQTQLANKKGSDFHIELNDNTRFRAILIRVEDEFLVVESNRATKRWKVQGKESKIPRSELVSVRQAGRRGHWEWILAAGGGAAGGGIAAAALPSSRSEDMRPYAAAYAALGSTIGYFAGFFVGKPYPELRVGSQYPSEGVR